MSVASLAVTMPAFFKAISARKKPIPAAIPNFKLRGMELISQALKGEREIKMNKIPEINTAPRAVCHGCPEPRTIA